MKTFVIFFILCFLSNSIFAEKISTIKLSYLIENSTEYQSFIEKLELKKQTLFKNLQKDEKILEAKKIEIDESKLVLSGEEYNNLISIYNKEVKLYQDKIDKFNFFLEKNININQKKIIDEIFILVKDISINNKIDLVLNEDQYFISSESNDISQIVLNKLNNKKLNLEIINE